MPEDLNKLEGNSFKKRAEEKKPVEIEASSKLTPVTKGIVVVKKKSWLGKLSETIFGNDTNSVGSHILYNILIPAAKDTIEDMVTSGIKMVLFRDSRGSGRYSRERDKDRSIVSYTGYYKDRGRDFSRRDRGEPLRAHLTHKFDEIIINNRREGEEVIDQLIEMIEKYGQTSVADFYDLIDLPSEYSDNKYGWRNLSRAAVERGRDGYYFVLPKAEPLD